MPTQPGPHLSPPLCPSISPLCLPPPPLYNAQVDLYENGTIAIVEAVSPELGNRVQRVRVQLPGTSSGGWCGWLVMVVVVVAVVVRWWWWLVVGMPCETGGQGAGKSNVNGWVNGRERGFG